MKQIILGITGASGSIYGIRLLAELNKLNINTHLILSNWARETITIETEYTIGQVKEMADHVYEASNLAARVASGSFRTDGMIIAPCSMKTLSAIANGYADNLIARAADVTIKEGRKLIIVPRETPLSQIHLRNMLTLSELGVAIIPPIPAFYHKPNSIEDIVNHSVGKVLDNLNIEHYLYKRWE